MAAQSTVKTRAITCPNCGGGVQLRGFAHTLSVTCSNCRTVLDTSSGEPSILARAQAQMKVEPLIPLGFRGTFEGVQYEAIGFEQRYTISEGETFCWQEYVLFHPYKGFRYLSEYNGHWSFIRPTDVLPSGTYFKIYDGHLYKPFQKAVARTGFVIGEFPWRVSIGEAVTMIDNVSPPFILSSESNANETTWSVGRYATGDEIWKAFKLPGEPPKSTGVYANQPNPLEGKPAASFKMFGLFFAAALAILIFFAMTHKSEPVFTASYKFDPTAQTDQSAVSEPFQLTGSHTSAVHIESRAAVSQNWLYLTIALVNVDTNMSYDFSEMLSYYSGVDDGESWSEGSSKQGTTVHRVPPGRYYIRIDPEREREAGESPLTAARVIEYKVAVFQGATNVGLFFIVILLLLPPPIIAWWRYRHFETQRWTESDMSGGSE
jgi:Domain of unknown function (DUF4178)